ncbi:MAG: class I SAM-dependent methyltransferase [Candidatus Wallbacteria bacterium]|nr:class I SAM-dependent methyltransferase [Candidatus Wallbacteria bacterium]
MNCRYCKKPLNHVLIDLGNSPPSNSFLTELQLNEPETFYPLKIFVCDSCFLVQIDEFKRHDEIFSADYAYFSSYSQSWLMHCRNFAGLIRRRLSLGPQSLVLEIASNDGYLLQYFKEDGIPVLGIEPARNTAFEAIQKGIQTRVEFFTEKAAFELCREGLQADLLVGNNVLAHVPDINDFVSGMKLVLKPGGTITMEFPHLMKLISGNQFDTIYHEHFSYLSLTTVSRIFSSHGLTIFDVDELPTHGGSLRIYAAHSGNCQLSSRYNDLLNREEKEGMSDPDYYRGFQAQADSVKNELLSFLIDAKKSRKTVAAYGAAAKGNTLLNYCGIKRDLISYVVDKSPHKIGKFLPGSHIPVMSEDEIRKTKPDLILILPWNLSDEIMSQLGYIGEWEGKFVKPIPKLEVL